MSTLAVADGANIESFNAAIADLRAQIDHILTSQRTTLEAIRDDIRRSGVDAHLIRVYKSDNRPQHVGDIGILWEHFRHNTRSLSFYVQRPYTSDDRRGVYARSSGDIALNRGLYEVVAIGAVDDDYEPTLIAKTTDVLEEAGHGRALTRLRNLARRDHMRVQVRDRQVTLLSPMNDVVHVGDVTSATLWLLGVDPTSLHDATF